MIKNILTGWCLLGAVLYSINAISNENIAPMTKLLEAQMECKSTPEPGQVIRAMLEQGLLVETEDITDGIPILKPTQTLIVYGKAVTFIAGWQEEEDGSVKEPFIRLPFGTAPPRHLSRKRA